MSVLYINDAFCGKCTQTDQNIIGYKTDPEGGNKYLYEPTQCSSKSTSGETIYAGVPGSGRPSDGTYPSSPACRSTCINGIVGDRNRTLTKKWGRSDNINLTKERGVELYENFGLDEVNRSADSGIYGPKSDWENDININDSNQESIGDPLINGNIKRLHVRTESERGTWYQSTKDAIRRDIHISEDDTYSNPLTYLAHRQKHSVIQDLGRKVSIFGDIGFQVVNYTHEIPVITNMQKYYSRENGIDSAANASVNEKDTGWQGYNEKTVEEDFTRFAQNLPAATVTLDGIQYDGMENYPFISGRAIQLTYKLSEFYKDSDEYYYEYFGDNGIEISVPQVLGGEPTIYRIKLSDPLYNDSLTYSYGGKAFYFMCKHTIQMGDETYQSWSFDAAFYALLENDLIGTIVPTLKPRKWNIGPNITGDMTSSEIFLAPICPVSKAYDGDASFQSEIGVYGDISNTPPLYYSGSGFKSMYIPPHMEVLDYIQTCYQPNIARGGYNMYTSDRLSAVDSNFNENNKTFIFSCSGNNTMYRGKSSTYNSPKSGSEALHSTIVGGSNSGKFQYEMVASFHRQRELYNSGTGKFVAQRTRKKRSTSDSSYPYFNIMDLPSSFVEGEEQYVEGPNTSENSLDGSGVFPYLGTNIANNASSLIDGVSKSIDYPNSIGIYEGSLTGIIVSVRNSKSFVRKYVYGTNPNAVRADGIIRPAQSFCIPEIILNPDFSLGQLFVENNQNLSFKPDLDSLALQEVTSSNISTFWDGASGGPVLNEDANFNDVIPPVPITQGGVLSNLNNLASNSLPTSKKMKKSRNPILRTLSVISSPVSRAVSILTRPSRDVVEPFVGRISSMTYEDNSGIWSAEWTYVLFYCAMNGPVYTSITSNGIYQFDSGNCKECSLFYDPLDASEGSHSLSTSFMISYCGWRNLTFAYSGDDTGLGSSPKMNECQCVINNNVCPTLLDPTCRRGATPQVYVGEDVTEDGCSGLVDLEGNVTICYQSADQFYYTEDGNLSNNSQYIQQTLICDDEAAKINNIEEGVDNIESEIISEVEARKDEPEDPSTSYTSLIILFIVLVIIICAIVVIYYTSVKSSHGQDIS